MMWRCHDLAQDFTLSLPSALESRNDTSAAFILALSFRSIAPATRLRKGNPMKPKINITVELTDDQAMALAHYLKRCVWADVLQSAASDEEGYLIRDAFDAMQYALTDAGFTPP